MTWKEAAGGVLLAVTGWVFIMIMYALYEITGGM